MDELIANKFIKYRELEISQQLWIAAAGVSQFVGI